MIAAPRLRTLVTAVCIAMLALGAGPASHAGVAGTADYLEAQSRQAHVEAVSALLQREAVREQLLRFGVTPARVEARLDALTAQEMATLHESIESQAAGGDVLGLIGAVFVVLLILELLGVTNVFSAI